MNFLITAILLFLSEGPSHTLFYNGYIGTQNLKFLVDTGSAYTVISKKDFDKLDKSLLIYEDKIAVRTAVGKIYKLPLYRVKELWLGLCRVTDIQVLIVRDQGTNLIGMETLKKLSPFSIYFEPPMLNVSC